MSCFPQENLPSAGLPPPPRASSWWRLIAALLTITLLVGCTSPSPAPAPYDPAINLDAETQALISRARRTVFLIPFSHWDTDWHDTFASYSRRADQNILAAIQLARQHSRFRYALEQVLFVQHFWDTHPASRDDLKALVQKKQITFAWAGLTQPETSLAAPGVQLHNLLLGREWIAETFGEEAVPTGAWQSDAFGNSAALPVFLSQTGISHLYIGRWPRCRPEEADCLPLPHAFYWQSPLASPELSPGVLVASLSYLTAWATLADKATPQEQIAALQGLFEEQYGRTTSRYLIVPYGFDFLDPDPMLLDLVERWNAADMDPALVIADPQTAFQYLATQNLPTLAVDMNPLWQAFYGTRPYARIADKQSEFYLTATDKFGNLLEDPQAGDWQLAAVNAHYDNLSAVGYDQVWEASQRPRFAESVRSAAEDLADVLAGIASRVLAASASPDSLLIFNSVSWPRGGVVEISGELPEEVLQAAPQLRTAPHTVAFLVQPAPPTGYSLVKSPLPAAGSPELAVPPAVALRDPGGVTLSNELVAVRLQAGQGGTFSSLSLPGETPIELLAGSGDDLVYIEDGGDVYGARFGQERARQSQVPARIELMAAGPLVARARVNFSLDGQPITKTVSLRAGSPLIEVTLEMQARPETSALVHTPTALQTGYRTDDLGFAAFQHPVDTRPIVPGDITYRRKIFYPVTYWSDVSSAGYGLSLITHGIQGVAGTDQLYLLLARSVSDAGNEGVLDEEQHILRYAYFPHRGSATEAQPWKEAYAFNQPLILAWREGDQILVQVPFREAPLRRPFAPSGEPLPDSLSLAAAESGLIVDLYPQRGRLHALVVDYDPVTPASLQYQRSTLPLPSGLFWWTPLE